MRNYTASRQMGSWTQLLNSPEPGSVRRAESAGNGPLYNGAVSMNVPTQSSSINDIARLFAGMDGQGLSRFAVHRPGPRTGCAWTTFGPRTKSCIVTRC
jgi:hypothetical protein